MDDESSFLVVSSIEEERATQRPVLVAAAPAVAGAAVAAVGCVGCFQQIGSADSPRCEVWTERVANPPKQLFSAYALPSVIGPYHASKEFAQRITHGSCL